MAYDRATELEVASKLEDLTVVMKQMVTDLREGQELKPYAAIYWLRREISREVAKLGAGAPSARSLEQIENYYTSFVQS